MIVTLAALALSSVSARAHAGASDAATVAQGQVVLAQIAAATSDETMLDPTYVAYSAWLPLAQSAPLASAQLVQAGVAWGQAIAAAASRDTAACLADDLNQIARLAGLLNWVSNHGLVLAFPGVSVADIQSRLQNCASFQLEIASTVNTVTQDGPLTATTSAKVPLTASLNDGTVVLSGAGTINYDSQVWPQTQKCTITGVGVSGGLAVNGTITIGIETAVPFHETVDGSVKLAFAITPQPVENITVACPDATRTAQTGYWYAAWSTLRLIQGQIQTMTGQADFGAQPLTNSSTAATVTLTGNLGTEMSETGSVRLRHTAN